MFDFLAPPSATLQSKVAAGDPHSLLDSRRSNQNPACHPLLQSGMDSFQNVDFVQQNHLNQSRCVSMRLHQNCVERYSALQSLQTQLNSEPLSSAWAFWAFREGLFQYHLMLFSSM